jgi:hypothetical protein
MVSSPHPFSAVDPFPPKAIRRDHSDPLWRISRDRPPALTTYSSIRSLGTTDVDFTITDSEGTSMRGGSVRITWLLLSCQDAVPPPRPREAQNVPHHPTEARAGTTRITSTLFLHQDGDRLCSACPIPVFHAGVGSRTDRSFVSPWMGNSKTDL